MSVIITSFRKSDDIIKYYSDSIPFSVSRWQPKGYFYYKLPFLGAYDKNNRRLFLRGRIGDPIEGYKKDWLEYIIKNWEYVNEWLKALDNNQDILLCCWCPYSNATKKQIKQFGTFVCHTLLIGRLINKYRPDVQLIMDKDHSEQGIKEWEPYNYKKLDI